jgi:prepilin-type N-terminal cleavage/methylation domain-containing protein
MKTLNRITKRAGVTLTEVLMSLMIMSIGISAVAVLFPISVLRSVQATQLTNAAILKRNAQALLDMRQELVFDPDGDGNFDEHIGARQELNYIVDPSGYFEMATGAARAVSCAPSL